MSQPDNERFLGASPDQEQQRPIALTRLNEWFINQGIPQDRATTSTERIQTFYDLIQQQPHFYGGKIGITGELGETTGRPHASLSLLFPTPFGLDSLEQTKQVNDLAPVFADQVILPRLPSDPSIHLVVTSLAPGCSFEDHLKELSETQNGKYFGILDIDHQPQNKTP